MTFAEFLAKYRDGSLEELAEWRAYDFMAPQRMAEYYVRKALKQLGLRYAGELAVGEVEARYGVRGDEPTCSLLIAWHLWQRVARGERIRNLPLRAGNG